MGASSSRRLGCARNISLEATQSWRTSASLSWTCLPGRPLRTSSSRAIISSSTALSIPPPSLFLPRRFVPSLLHLHASLFPLPQLVTTRPNKSYRGTVIRSKKVLERREGEEWALTKTAREKGSVVRGSGHLLKFTRKRRADEVLV